VLNKYTIIGLIVGCVISGLGVASMIDSFVNPIETIQTNDTFGIGGSDKIRFNAPANSFQTLIIIGDTFDVKILTTDEKIISMIAIRTKQLFHGQIWSPVKM